MENANPSSPLESPDLFRNREICDLDALFESLNLTAPPLEKDFSYLEGDPRFVELFKKYEIGDLSDGEQRMKKKQLEPRIDPKDLRRIRNFTGRTRGMHIFVGNFTYVVDFLIVEDISLVIDPCLLQVVLGEPFDESSNMIYDSSLGIVKFTNRIDEVAYKMPHKIEQFQSLSNMEKEHK
ncbi:hypothetical protein Tco_0636358 [Tanacetum coccineum]